MAASDPCVYLLVGRGRRADHHRGRIRVELDSRDSHPRVGRYGRIGAAVQNLSTVVTGRLGEWIPLGGVSRSYSGSGSALVSGGVGGGTADDSVYIKVEQLE